MSALNHDYFIEMAIELAKEAEKLDEVPIGAVLVHQDQVIGQGYNLREKSGRTTAHAEIIALENYNQLTGEWRLPTGTALYVTVEPCMMCTGALLSARVERVFFGATDQKRAGLSRFESIINEGVFDHRFLEVRSGIAQEQCAHLISNYFRKKRARSMGD